LMHRPTSSRRRSMLDSRASSLTSVPSVALDAGQLTSDGGLVWLAQPDDHLGLSASFSAQIRDGRRGPVRHALVLLLRQRLPQIACDYEDQNDADTLRHDPLLTLVCGRHPHKPSSDVASQPTFSRLENSGDRRACYRLAHAQNTLARQNRIGFAIVATHWRHRWLVGFG
jgi:Transposase DDE domain group 1